jgi:pimeloyl-ACP methyl ester carboxylesterase
VSDDGWTYAGWMAAGVFGEVAVPGAVLSYRLSGPEKAACTVVIENGWSAPFAYAVWLEQALSSRVRVLCYDRAGVGDSRSTAPASASAMTQHLAALLDAHGVCEPVVIVGHSYGGLLAALHAAQNPERVKAIVQIDGTPEFENALIDRGLRAMPAFARFMQLCALIGYDTPMFGAIKSELPPEIFSRIRRNRRWLVRSLGGSIAEIRLLMEIRANLAAAGGARDCPRLTISSTAERKHSWLSSLFVKKDQIEGFVQDVWALHKRQAALNAAGRWLGMPYEHVSLVSDRVAATAVANHIFDFIE